MPGERAVKIRIAAFLLFSIYNVWVGTARLPNPVALLYLVLAIATAGIAVHWYRRDLLGER